MIAKKVMKLDEFKDAVFYRVACDCTSSDCDLTFEMEWDEEFDMITLGMYEDLRWSSHWVDYDKFGWWWRDKWLRLKVALRVLFTGYIKVEGWLILQGEEHVGTFIEALQEGKKKVSEGKVELNNAEDKE